MCRDARIGLQTYAKCCYAENGGVIVSGIIIQKEKGAVEAPFI